MKKILISIALLACLISGYAHAATYTYTGAYYDAMYGGNYTADMRITGSFTTSSPIPPNSLNIDVSGIATSWSFNDGLQTINNVNGVFDPEFIPRVNTDASGNISRGTFFLFLSPIPTVIGGKASKIEINGTTTWGDSWGIKDATCTGGTEGGCGGLDYHDYGWSTSPGTWVTTVETIFADGFE